MRSSRVAMKVRTRCHRVVRSASARPISSGDSLRPCSMFHTRPFCIWSLQRASFSAWLATMDTPRVPSTMSLTSLGAKVETACCDFSEVNDIVLGTRGVSMVASHAEKLARWRDQMQKGLVWNIEQGLKLSPEEIGRAEALRTTLWHRVRTFMATRELLILPTVAVPPFPVETPYPTEINGKPLDNYTQWFFLTYGITLTGLPAIS